MILIKTGKQKLLDWYNTNENNTSNIKANFYDAIITAQTLR